MLPKILFTLIVSYLWSGSVNATTWAETTRNDPILEREKCSVFIPTSYGSYVYALPSKYDLVFWPFIDSNSIWFCKKSGFISFMGDFEEMPAAEKKVIAAYLKDNYVQQRKALSLRDRLLLLEKLYALRKMDESSRIRILRIFAYYYESELNDQLAARKYREMALGKIKQALSADIDNAARIDYLFVAAAYEREFGNIKSSDSYVKLLNEVLSVNRDEKLKNYIDYIQSLIKDIPRITPGGVLAPADIPQPKAGT